MMNLVKNLVKKIASNAGYRIVPNTRPGLDWIDDCQTIFQTANGHRPRFDVVFDVGANIGQTAIELHKRTKPRTIHCFEPVSATFAELQSNTQHLPEICNHNFALSDSDGESTINLYDGSVLASLCDKSPILSIENQLFRGTETISMQTLDGFVSANGIESIDLLKIDTEGADLRVLHGARGLLADQKVQFIVFEFYKQSSKENENGLFFPIDSFLSDLGYRFLSCYTDFVNPSQPTGIYNALYCRWPV